MKQLGSSGSPPLRYFPLLTPILLFRVCGCQKLLPSVPWVCGCKKPLPSLPLPLFLPWCPSSWSFDINTLHRVSCTPIAQSALVRYLQSDRFPVLTVESRVHIRCVNHSPDVVHHILQRGHAQERWRDGWRRHPNKYCEAMPYDSSESQPISHETRSDSSKSGRDSISACIYW